MNEKLNANHYRADLPPVPKRMLKLPVLRQYPVPWFVAEIDGVYDFRVVGPGKLTAAIRKNLCWVCGETLGDVLAFVIGPMCAVNRVSSEPPSHRECAEWSARACPFLTQKQQERRMSNLPEGTAEMAGISIKRQPGVALVWLTRRYRPFNAGNGILIKIGDPLKTLWFREGRAATRAEIMDSIESGLPILREMAQYDGAAATRALEKQIRRGMRLVPHDDAPAPKLKLGSAAKRCPFS